MAYSSALVLDERFGTELVAHDRYRHVSAKGYAPATETARQKGAFSESDVARQKAVYNLESYPLSLIEKKHRLLLETHSRHARRSAVTTSAYQGSLMRMGIYACVCVAAFVAMSFFLASAAYPFVLPAAIVFFVSFVLTMVRFRIHLGQHTKLTENPYPSQNNLPAAA